MTSPKNKDNKTLNGVKTLTRIIYLVIAGLIVFISKYAFTFFIFAILPSITAVFIDRRSNKFASSTICAFNITAIMPYLFQLFRSQEIATTAQEFIGNIHVWLSIYGITSLGWIIIWSVPQICGKIFQIKALTTIHTLKTKQNAIVEEWGPEVKH